MTRIFPLTERAVEIVEARREANTDSKFIFTTDGEPVATDYGLKDSDVYKAGVRIRDEALSDLAIIS